MGTHSRVQLLELLSGDGHLELLYRGTGLTRLDGHTMQGHTPHTPMWTLIIQGLYTTPFGDLYYRRSAHHTTQNGVT